MGDERKLVELAQRARATEHFMARLAYEVKRAERYKRFFSVLVLSPKRALARDLFNRVRPWMRNTDIVEVIERRGPAAAAFLEVDVPPPAQGPSDERPMKVVAILPEANGRTAHIVAVKLKGCLTHMPDVTIGSAGYPEDGTDPLELLRAAAANPA